MQSFEELFRRHFGQIYRFALSLTRSTDAAEDIA